MKEQLKKYLLDIFSTTNKKITFIAFLTVPFICNIVIEMFNSRSFINGMTYLFRDTFSFVINLAIIVFSISFCLLLKKRLAYIFTVGMIWIALGVVNFVITSKRTTPFSVTDFALLGSIDDIIKKYLNPVEFITIIIAIALVVMAVTVVWIKFPKYSDKIKYLRNIIMLVVSFALMMIIIEAGFLFGALSAKFPNMTIAYKDYGFPYCFVTSFVNKGVEQPDEYSKENVMEIIEKLESTKTVDSEEERNPNIIFLQLESFFDVNKLIGLELSVEATPIFNQLKEDYPSGYLTVNNVGYGTANTEFEIMTGLNLDDFGPGEFPYTTILTNTTCETTGYILKNYGYSAHAIHNNTATFYSRRTVFKRLGFDSFTSLEYMYPEEYTPTEWVKDEILTDEILKVLNSTEDSDYVYAISVQGHGDYPAEPVLEEPKIQVTGGIEDEGRRYMVEYYVNMISEMDTFVGNLIDELDKLKEDTVLVIYGDHLPSLDINEEELENKNLYQTEYVVWNNFDLKMSDKDIESYQLSSRVLEHLNIDGGVINKFHQVYNNNNSEYLEKLHLLTFDILYGNMFTYDGINPYIATDMKMGTNDIVIKAVERARNKDLVEAGVELEEQLPNDEDNQPNETINPYEPLTDWYLVKGEYFTECSFVGINGVECDTSYIDSETLLIYAPELDSLDVFVINQKSNSTILSTSSEFTYFNIFDTPEGILQDDEDNKGDNFGVDQDTDGDI